MNKRINPWLVIALLVTCGAASSSNPIVSHSDFDGSTEVRINPHGLDCGFRMEGLALGAIWSTAWSDGALLQVETSNHFASMSSAAFNVDGRIIELEMQGTTDHGYGGAGTYSIPESKGIFKSDLATIREIVAARSSMLRLTTNKGYEECYIRRAEKPKGSRAFGALQRFVGAVDKIGDATAKTP